MALLFSEGLFKDASYAAAKALLALRPKGYAASRNKFLGGMLDEAEAGGQMLYGHVGDASREIAATGFRSIYPLRSTTYGLAGQGAPRPESMAILKKYLEGETHRGQAGKTFLAVAGDPKRMGALDPVELAEIGMGGSPRGFASEIEMLKGIRAGSAHRTPHGFEFQGRDAPPVKLDQDLIDAVVRRRHGAPRFAKDDGKYIDMGPSPDSRNDLDVF